MRRILLSLPLARQVWMAAFLLGSMPSALFGDSPAGELLAFPGAEGFGRFAKGGRGGDVYHVTNLKDDGEGSLRAAVATAKGPRTIVFDIAGTIELKTPLVVEKSFLTFAGQTAPGSGICIKDQTFRIRKAEHIIIRYMRFRLGDENKPRPSGPDCLNTDDINHVIFDHITASWGIDGNHDLRRGGNFTLQWSIYAEALHESIHEKGGHAMLASFRDLTAGITLHHNLFASSRERHPTLGGSPHTKPEAVADFRNNVIYNAEGATNLGNCRINVIANMFLPGPNTPKGGRPISVKTEVPGALKVFLAGNIFESHDDWTKDNTLAVDVTRWAKGNYLRLSLSDILSDKEFDVGAARPKTEEATVAYEQILREAGASLVRDDADQRLVAGIRDRSHRMINSPRDVGGWPVLRGEIPPADTDKDGMPNDWELERGLDPAVDSDRNADLDNDGYTNLEEYHHGLGGRP